jgi:DnaK suppressor protein
MMPTTPKTKIKPVDAVEVIVKPTKSTRTLKIVKPTVIQAAAMPVAVESVEIIKTPKTLKIPDITITIKAAQPTTKVKKNVKTPVVKISELSEKSDKSALTAAKLPASTALAHENKIPTPALTDADVVPSLETIQAMPESDYMCSAQLRYFQAVLEKMRAEILSNSDSTTEHLRDNVVVPDPIDRATIEEEHAIELRTRDRERKLLKKITQALEAIEQGEYGWCEETGDAIGLRRLLARPTATLSLEAQERRELKQKMYGD